MRVLNVLVVLALLNPTAVRAATLEDLEFLVGHWRGEAFGGTIEEIWLPAHGDVMHGVFRAVADGAMSFSEFLQVTVEDGDVVLRFAHFRADYSTWEGDGPPMELRLVRTTDTSATFEAMNEDTPGTIDYTRDDDSLVVTVGGIEKPLRFTRVD